MIVSSGVQVPASSQSHNDTVHRGCEEVRRMALSGTEEEVRSRAQCSGVPVT